MSTRGVIARATGESQFKGRYHHWDSYPTGLGATLVNLYTGHFKGDLAAMLKYLIDDHPAGFSTINGANFNLPAGHRESLAERWGDKPGPKCFCHGDRHEGEQIVTEKDDVGAEWAYVFNEEEKIMHVLRMMVRNDEGEQRTVTGMFGFGVEGQYWEHAADIDLKDLSKLDWGKVECGENYERCTHYAYFHFPQLKGTDMAHLGTLEYLGQRELDTDVGSAVAFIVNGKRAKYAGSARREPMGNYYPAYWVASVKYGNNKRADVRVAVQDGPNDSYKPVPGVAWVFPPTLRNPQETILRG